MWAIGKRLGLGVSLILIASAILLISDVPRRSASSTDNASSDATRSKTFQVALLQMTSQGIMEDGASGVIAGLAEQGFVEGQNLAIRRFNPQGDIAVVNTMAQELTSGSYDLVVTLSTPCLQAVANANRQGRVPHVFGMVSDPQASGVGIGPEPLDHPPHLVGIGTMPPAAESLELAKQINPQLTRVGVVWNPAEINSEICTQLAREACKKMKIELLEANAENSAAVREATVSLVTRGVDALWIGGDVTVLAATDVLIRVANDAKIPVFTCIPGNVTKGTLFDIGANYYEVGRSTGRLAAQILAGEAVAKLPVTKAIPPRLMLNKVVSAKLEGRWTFPEASLASADSILDEQGMHDKPQPSAAPVTTTKPPTNAPLGRKASVEIVSYVNTPDTDEAIAGLRAGLERAGVVEGPQLELKVTNAQGDMATLNTIVEAALARQPDLLLTVSTQVLQSAVQRSRSTPIVFTMVANPFLAGVGKTNEDHHALATGAYGANDAEAMVPLIRELLPKAKRVGALFAPAETNSAYSHELLVKAIQQTDLELISLPINAPSDVPEAAQSLCSQQIDLICLPNSNLAGSSFPSIARAAQRAKIPVFGFLGSLVSQGASVVLTRDFRDMGEDSGAIAARVLRGERTQEIPFFQATKSRLLVNPRTAAECGLTLPEALIKRADQVLGP